MNNDCQRAMQLLPLISRRRAEDNASWMSICIALKNCGVPYEVFEKWSLTGKYCDRNQIRRAWQNLRGDHSIGTLCYYAHQDFGRLPPPPRCPEDGFDGEKAFYAIIAPFEEYSELELENELWERSPYRLNEKVGAHDMVALLENLYDMDDRIFIGDVHANTEMQRQGINTVREHLQDLKLAEFFRPNPLTGSPVIRNNGRPSFVCDQCVAKYRYAVVEFDGQCLQRQLAFFLAMLNKGFPIAALTYSGNKSVHALVAVNCTDAKEWETKVEKDLFRDHLEILGCDGACKNEGRCSRTPGAIRANGQKQRLLYLNPNVKGK